MNESKIQEYRRLINSKLLEIYTDGPPSLIDPIKYVMSGRGKRLRPILTLITAKTCGAVVEEALPAALSVETLHNFTLVHDDIMDEDHTRHGQLTVHEKWDVGTAVLTGDAMVSLALKTMQKSKNNSGELMRVFTEGLLKVCEGQAFDKEFEIRSDLTIDEYISMIDLKTGHLLGLAADVGAIIGNADENDRRSLRNYARLLGRAFQVQDDVLEIFSDSSKMGKSLKSDILLGKKTYLMINALTEFPNEINKAIVSANHDFSNGLSEIRAIIKSNGIKEKAISFVRDTIFEANNILKTLKLDTSDLFYFSQMITNRRN